MYPLSRANVDEIRRAISVLFDDSLVELRIMNAVYDERPLGTVSGYFDAHNREQLAQAAEKWSGIAPAVYVTLNPVVADCAARASNRVVSWSKNTTTDVEIACRRWLFIDCDPKRPAGVSSTDAEHEAAIAQAQAIRLALTSLGWPEPILADSSNGSHLLYRIDLPNDDESKSLIKVVLEALDEQFSTDTVTVDRSVFNAARICKLYGTESRKGDNVADRPHRISRMLNVPERIDVVSREQLEAIASQRRRKASPTRHSTPVKADGFDVSAWLARFNIGVRRQKPWEKGSTLFELVLCPWRPDATDGGAFVIQFPNGSVVAGCHHNSCQEKNWSALRDLYEPGWRNNDITPAKAAEVVDDPHRLAQLYITKYASHETLGLTLRWWQSEWYYWNGSIYVPRPNDDVRAQLVKCIKEEFDRYALEETQRGRPTVSKPVGTTIVNNVIQALQSLTLLPASMQPPKWIEGKHSEWDGDDTIVAKNGLIHLPSLRNGKDYSLPASPSFFALNSLEYEVTHNAGVPELWHAFLNDLWPDDPQSVETLQLWFGLSIVPDTSQQKILGVFGPPRSGKGTIARVLEALLGQANVVSPTLASLAAPFGLHQLVQKLLAIVSDARLSGRSDSSIIIERLLSISGEDKITIDRKHKSAITVRLTSRFIIMSNELPRLVDSSGAFASRLIMLRLTRSFLGSEDQELTDKLLKELPAIFLWAVEGWAKLRSGQRLREPDSARVLREDIEEIGSPVMQFVSECCEVGPFREIARIDLYIAYTKWCKRKGITSVEQQPVFGRNLRAAVPNLENSHIRTIEGRQRCYVGIDLTDTARRE